MTQKVLVTLDGGVQVLTLNRTDKKNALTPEMYGALADGLERADADPDVRVTLITAMGDAFTAGNDMGDFAKAGAAPLGEEPGEKTPVTRFIENLGTAEKPVIAAVNGLAVGIGVTMLLHCDLVYAAESATFQMPFVRLGLVPEAGSTLLLPRLIGLQKASDLFLTGRKISAAAAEALGLIAEVFPDDALGGEALARAKAVAAQAPTAVRLVKSLMKSNDREVVAAQSAAEGVHFAAQLRSAEVKEAVSAFFEKRPADFSQLR
ncbi:enoyl-CoA hydratase [Phenylobacterium sp.]|uniref:enoyl-CoA hydratase n=1 Tax=Phenylobacterium sp. TaxID=1871053 RepID=UPI002FC5AF69